MRFTLQDMYTYMNACMCVPTLNSTNTYTHVYTPWVTHNVSQNGHFVLKLLGTKMEAPKSIYGN